MNNEIKDGQVVELSYVLKNTKGEELDSATNDAPLAYLHGSGQIIPGLEDALLGLKVGDKKSVTIAPENAYGIFDPSLKMKIHSSHFPQEQKIQVGMQFVAEIKGGHVPFVIQKIEDDHVFVDGNHPLAGETLHFDVAVVSIREATKDELSHGHAHGPGGAHH